MKNIILILIAFYLLIPGYSSPVDPVKASIAAKNFIQSQTSIGNARLSGDLELVQVFPKVTSKNGRMSEAQSTPYYIYNLNDNNGFIIISGDDAALPVLGYSFEGAYIDSLLPPAFVKWMEGYKKEILYLQANNIKSTSEIAEKWRGLELGIINNTNPRLQAVNPLIQTKWDQKGNSSEPNQNLYNSNCPQIPNKSDKALTGCVATAMAQIMKYWGYPNKGTSFHSYTPANSNFGTLSANFSNTNYDWNNMPNQLNKSSTSVQIQSIATLMSIVEFQLK